MLKIFSILLLFFSSLVFATMHDELLTQLKQLAVQGRFERMNRCKRNFEGAIDANLYSRTVAEYRTEYESWLKHVKLDHIKLFLKTDVGYKVEYVQLENSRAYPIFGFSRIYPINQKHNDLVLESLSQQLLGESLDAIKPHVQVYISKKRRLEKGLLCFSKEIDDLYSVFIDFSKHF